MQARSLASNNTSLAFGILLSWTAYSVHLFAFRFVSDGIGLEYYLNTHVLWPVLGVPQNVYSMRNIVLPRIIVFVIITCVPLLFGLSVFALCRHPHRWRLLTGVLCSLASSCVFMAIAQVVSGPEKTRLPSPWISFMFAAYIALSFIFLVRCLSHFWAATDTTQGSTTI